MERMQKRDSRRQRYAEIRQALRELRVQLSAVNHQVSGRVQVRGVDVDCLDVIERTGPLSPSVLAKLTGLHPATLTGILDRLERGGFVVRERSTTDRRAVMVRGQPTRVSEMYRLYAGMNAAIDEICAGYEEAELAVIADFLRRVAGAGANAAAALADEPAP
jgi:DNA-binding MarR family transcriptional regulator